MSLTAAETRRADQLWLANNNTQQIALYLGKPEHQVERALHWLWDGEARARSELSG